MDNGLYYTMRRTTMQLQKGNPLHPILEIWYNMV